MYYMINNRFKLYKGVWVDTYPPHLSQKFSAVEMHEVLKHKRGGNMLRNTFDWDVSEETSFWYVIKDTFGGLEELSSKKRNQVKKSLKTYDVRRVTPEEILEIGLPIYNAAIESYKVKIDTITKEQFEGRIQSSVDSGKADFWVVYEKTTNSAVALAINTVYDDCCEYNTMKADPKYMRNSTYPYYGLIYEMNKYYLEEKSLKYVNDGARSITNHSNIQSMLIDVFNFRKAYCQLQIEYRWWFGAIVKILYPFRKIIPSLKVRSILNMESMRRG